MSTFVRARRVSGLLVVTAVLVSPVASTPVAVASPPQAPTAAAPGLPLGPSDLTEQRTTTTLQRGVTLTSILRGAVDPAAVWTVEVSIPSGPSSPDPDAPAAALSDRASADALAARLGAAGFEPRVEEVTTPATADYAGGSLGFRVRVGRVATKAESDALLARLVAAGFAGSSRYTGWDGSSAARGPWRVQVLAIDPHHFRGSLIASYGPDIERRETTSALSRAAGATAATNAGYFVLDPKAGAPGDPAGVGVYDGRLLSETVGHRPALVLHESARRTEVERLTWTGSVQGRNGRRLTLDGIDRVPGLIRNCGGTADDLPTALPLHDFTCTDGDELVAFTRQFGVSTPSGPGAEVVLNRRSRVVAVRSTRGVALRAGYRSVQATGNLADDLESVAKLGRRLRLTTGLRGRGHHLVHPGSGVSVVNGGPELVRDGALHVTPRADGFVRPTEPSFYYGFSAERNPRTFAGTDAAGRTLIATVDGRSTASLGTTIVETAAVARALGMRDALNLDGGGSTTMVARGQVMNSPSDAEGERPVGDALLVLPRRR
jgi:hypothetical protein